MKKWLINGLGIGLALVLALGGLGLMEHLLEEKRARLLSSSGGLDETGLSLETAKPDGGQRLLTGEELRQVLAAMQGREAPHEPLEGQLSMEQAMERGKSWMEEFCLAELQWPGEQKYHKMDARLCRRQGEEERENSNILYSYWTVSLESQEVGVELTLHAVTGQVLEAKLSFHQLRWGREDSDYLYTQDFSDEVVWNLLERYADSFGLAVDPVLLLEQGYFSKSLNEGEFYAVAKTGSSALRVRTEELQMAEAGEGNLLYLSLSLEDH